MKYNLYLDRRVVVWSRDYYNNIEAENTEEAVQKILNHQTYPDDCEYLYETEYPMRNLEFSDIENTDDEIVDPSTYDVLWSGKYDS